MKEKFSLKDHLFNPEKIEYLAGLISPQAPKFNRAMFIQKVLDPFPQLELKERINHITIVLKEMLPEDYRSAVNILLASLPPELDPNKTDNDFGDFIFAPYSHYVALYGCQKKELRFSLDSLEELTKRFSVEYAIRPFLIKFPKETIKKVNGWARHENYHVRRLASEGIRPNLPWGQKADVPHETIVEILDHLYSDPTRFVTRSVANNLNDISKKKPDIVLETLNKWKKEKKQSGLELNFIINHTLRSLIKQGNPRALSLIGFPPNPKVLLNKFSVKKKTVQVGENLEFQLELVAEKNAKLLIDYSIYFQTHKGKLAPKVFKLKKLEMKKGEKLNIEKKHPLKLMTTKKLYPGKHQLEIQINGKPFQRIDFQLKSVQARRR